MDHILTEHFPNSHAFLIGINEYKEFNNLVNAVNDVEAITELLEDEIHGFQVYPPLINASHAEIMNCLDTVIPSIVKEKDRLLFYFAGHGVAMDSEQEGIPEGYMLPSDASINDESRSIAMSSLRSCLESLPCKHVLIVLDCCFSGAFRWANSEKRGIGRNIPKKIYKERFDRFVEDSAWQVLTSSSYDQEAFDSIYYNSIGTSRNKGNTNHSPFAFHFMNALKGEADLIPKDQPNGLITATELYIYIREKLESQTIAISHHDRQTPGLFYLPKHDKGEYLFLSPKVILNLPNYNPELNPYRGLQSYEIEDSNHFFGRDQIVVALEGFMMDQPFVVIAGASGSGKSSLVKAGLLPLMQKAGYTLLAMRPGEKPMDHLLLLLKYFESKTDDKILLFIDQFEELITQCHDKSERIKFLDKIASLLKNNHDRLKVILTVRSDFEPQFYKTSLGDNWEAARFVIPAFSASELREIIERPATERTILFDPPELIDQIVEEVQNAPAALPLLSFTMSELYENLKEKGEFGAFKLADYQLIGGVMGSLRKRADVIYDKLSSKQQVALQKLMFRMISFEGGQMTKRRVFLDELVYSIDSENITIEEVLVQLNEARLVVQGKDLNELPYVEPAHDTLIHAWGRLWDWVNSIGKETLLLQTRLQHAVVVYKENNKINNLLFHDDPRLDQFQSIISSSQNWLNKEEEEFIHKSIALKHKKRRRFITTLISTIAVLLLLTFAAIWFGIEAENQSVIAQKEAKSSSLAALAYQRETINPTQAIRIAEYANKIKPDNESAKQAVHDILSNSDKKFFYEKSLSGQNAADFSDDGKYILTASNNGHAKIWTSDGALINEVATLQDTILAVDISKDGKLFLTAGWHGKVRVWSFNGTFLYELDTHPVPIDFAKFSGDTKRMVIGSWARGIVHIINIEKEPYLEKEYFVTESELMSSRTRTRYLRRIHSKYNTEGILGISDDFNYVITESINENAHLGRVEDNKIFISNQNSDWFFKIDAVDFSGNSKRMMIGKEDGAIGVLSVEGEEIFRTKIPSESGVSAVAISPNEQYFAAADGNGNIYVWDKHYQLFATLIGHNGFITALTFSPDEKYLLSSTLHSKDAHLLWNLEQKDNAFLKYENKANINAAYFLDESKFIISSLNGIRIISSEGDIVKEVNLGGMDNAIFDMAISSDRFLLVGALYDALIVQQTMTGQSRRAIAHEGEKINKVALSPNDKYILTSGQDGLVKIWIPDLPLGKAIDTVYQNPSSPSYSIAFTANSEKTIIGKLDGTVELRALNGDLLSTHVTHTDAVLFAKHSNNGAYFLTGGMDGTAKLWSKDWQLIQTFKGFKKGILAGNFSLDDEYIILGGEEGIAKVFKIDGTLIQSFSSHDNMIKTASFSPSGQFALTGSDDGVVYYWEIKKDFLSSGKIASLPPNEKVSIGIGNDLESILQTKDKENQLAFAGFFEAQYLKSKDQDEQQKYLTNIKKIYSKVFEPSTIKQLGTERLKFLANYFGKTYVTDKALSEIYKENAKLIVTNAIE